MENLDKYTFNTRSGKVLSTEPFPNGNMLRSTSELLFLANEKLTKDQYSDFVNGMEDFSVRSGLYSRYSEAIEDTTIDDYLVLGSSRFLATEILQEARFNLGFITVNDSWTFKQFLFRFFGMWQHLRISAGEKVGIFGRAIWALSIYLAAKQPIEHQDNWCLSHIMIETYKRRGVKSWICDKAIAFWRSKKTKPTSQIMAEYTSIPDHPLVEAWKPYD